MVRMLPLILLLACKPENDILRQSGTDTWTQAENNTVDILFVVDDSSSMAEEQAALAAGFSSFAAQLDDSNTDFRLGVISTSFAYDDPARGRLVGEPQFLTPSDTDYQGRFAARAQLGTGGSNREKGLEAATYALSPIVNLDVNGGFSRPSARLLVVVVSDEEDCSDAGAIDGETSALACYDNLDRLTPIEDFVIDLRGMRDDSTDVSFAAIVGVAGDLCDPNMAASERYPAVAHLMGGTTGNICDGDWGGLLGELGLNAAGIQASFQLSRGADPDSIEVTVAGVPETDFTYDPETWYITFGPDSIPAREAVIEASYTIIVGQPAPPGL